MHLGARKLHYNLDVPMYTLMRRHVRKKYHHQISGPIALASLAKVHVPQSRLTRYRRAKNSVVDSPSNPSTALWTDWTDGLDGLDGLFERIGLY